MRRPDSKIAIATASITMPVAAALFAAACSTSAPASPSATGASAPATAAVAGLNATVSCSVSVGATTRPLPAVHELEGFLNAAITAAGSSVNCGQVRSLDAKLEGVARALDQVPQQFHAACGVSGALVNELESLVGRGELSLPTFPPPFPGGPTNVLAAAADLSGRWCAAARGDLVGPQP
jgi:hypothetical protein